MQEFVIEDVPVVEKVAETYNSIDEFFDAIRDRHWSSHYIKLVVRAKDRVVKGYTEKHHVIPKCMGGEDRKQNYVRLTAEEHYLAHQLLVKIFPEVRKLAYAAKMMTIHNKEGRSTNKMYGWIRDRVVQALKNMPDEQRNRLAAANTGRVKTKEEIEKTRLANTGRKNTDSMRERQSEILKAYVQAKIDTGESLATGRKLSEEDLLKMHEGLRKWQQKRKDENITISDETRAKLSAAGKGRKQTEEHINKRMAGKNRRDKNRSKMTNAEVIAMMADMKRGTKRSPEALAKQSITMLATAQRKREEKERSLKGGNNE